MMKANYNPKSSLNIKIIILLAVLIFGIISLYSMILSRYMQSYEIRSLGEESISTLNSLDSSIENIVNKANEYSKILVADTMIQDQMRGGDLFVNPTRQSEIIRKIYQMLQFTSDIDSIMLVDNKDQVLTVGGRADDSLQELDKWMEEVKKPYGTMVLRYTGIDENRHLSLVRSYNNLDDFTCLGIISVNISYRAVDQLIRNVLNLEQDQILILDGANQVIYESGSLLDYDQFEDWVKKLAKQPFFVEDAYARSSGYLVTGVSNQTNKWKLIRRMPLRDQADAAAIFRFNLMLVCGIGVLILLAAGWVSGLLTRPIQKLLNTMGKAESGHLTYVEGSPVLDEFKELFQGYNQMVDQIDQLFEETVEKQRRIRQVEMNEIQEQMKPHFLYNTLDSIQALALMGDGEKACQVIEALGSFYRRSVSGGREFISVGEEFQIVRDYISILGIRYENSFRYQEKMSKDVEKYCIPKLTVQPLVENAFQHGLRGKKYRGDVIVAADVVFFDGESESVEKRQNFVAERNSGETQMDHYFLHISVSDSGDGIPETVLAELQSDQPPTRGCSLGLRGTLERLSLIYGEDFSYQIRNGTLTEIHLYISLKALEMLSDIENPSR